MSAVLSIVRKVWPALSEPVLVVETDVIARAQSILTGSLLDGQLGPRLTPDQARDVVRWYDPRNIQ